MPEQKCITVYKFDELSDDAKEKAVELMQYINVDNGDWWYDEGLLELSEKEMKSRRIKLSDKWYEKSPHANIKGEYPAYTGLFEWKEIYFDIDRNSYIQFRGLTVNDDEIFRKFLRIPKRFWERLYYHFDEIPSRYGNTIIEFEDTSDRPFTNKQLDIITRATHIFSNKVHEALFMLRKNFEYQTSREGVEETIRINEYTFTEEGRRSVTL